MTALIVNFGSINIDHVYQVPHFVKPGETLASLSLSTGLGGKGANQSVAAAKAGANVAHIGRVSSNDQWAVELLNSAGVDTRYIELVECASGHAIIQVDAQGENAIVLHGGANQSFTKEELHAVFENISASGDSIEYLLMQNECNLLAQALDTAHALGIKTVLNPAPMTADIKELPLHQLDTLIVNQGEAEALCDTADIDYMVQQFKHLAPKTRVVITLGGDGAVLLSNGETTRVKAPAVTVVDTTAAGDTFVGYFLAGLVEGLDDKDALQRACLAASTTATREGAIASIPKLSEI